jgi:hypothetical protein
MSFRRDFCAMTRKALKASSGTAFMHCQILGGLLLLSIP